MALTRIYNVDVEWDVPLRMRDGVILYADIYRPAAAGRYPVLLIRLPYGKQGAENITYDHPAWYAQHGYIVVSQDVRGRWSSEGEWYPFRHEADDTLDTLAWVAELPGSTGQVGMFGFSYPGMIQLLAACKQPPSLTTICPGFTCDGAYQDWTYRNGALALSFVTSWAVQLAQDTAKRRRDHKLLSDLLATFNAMHEWYWYQPIREFPPLAQKNIAPYYFDWLEHPVFDNYWRQWHLGDSYEYIQVPALHVGGWYDIFISGTLRNFEGIRRAGRRDQKLLVGPWFHMPWTRMVGQIDFGPQARNCVNDWQLRWFDQFLKGEDTHVLDTPVTIFVMGAGVWRDAESWPLPGTEMVDFYFHSDGRANSAAGDGLLTREVPGNEPPDIFTYDPLAPTLSAGGHSCCFPFVAPMGPADQSEVEALNSVLVYTSAPLEQDLEICGPVTLTLYAASSAVDTDFTAKLCDVSPDGRSVNLQEGIMRARYRQSLTESSLLQPGEIYQYTIDLGPTCNRFRAGHRIRVQVSSSDFPQWDRNMNTGQQPAVETPVDAVIATQVVFHDANYPSHITLPIVPLP
jgi:putative CocE/NonD family hydrolase